jgi:biopolymer transport protein ExbB/TolQ
MNINFVELWSEMGIPVKVVVVVLTLQAIASIAVAIDRLIVLVRSEMASRAFAKRAAPLIQAADWKALYEEARGVKGSHLALLVYTALGVFLERTRAGDSTERAAELSRRASSRRHESVSEDLNRGMNILASTGSTAPFVGLLGTVLGILNAFQMIAESGSGGIGTIGSSIGEALVVTGYGLAVAIPTVLLFNWISGRVTRLETGLGNAESELADRLESVSVVTKPRDRKRVIAETASEELPALSY